MNDESNFHHTNLYERVFRTHSDDRFILPHGERRNALGVFSLPLTPGNISPEIRENENVIIILSFEIEKKECSYLFSVSY